jgi:hypothetical protein
VDYWTVVPHEADQAFGERLAFHVLFLSKNIWCFHRNIKMEVIVLIKGIRVDSEELEWRWNTVGDEAKHWVRIEGIIFIEGCSWYQDIVELDGLEVNDV